MNSDKASTNLNNADENFQITIPVTVEQAEFFQPDENNWPFSMIDVNFMDGSVVLSSLWGGMYVDDIAAALAIFLEKYPDHAPIGFCVTHVSDPFNAEWCGGRAIYITPTETRTMDTAAWLEKQVSTSEVGTA